MADVTNCANRQYGVFAWCQWLLFCCTIRSFHRASKDRWTQRAFHCDSCTTIWQPIWRHYEYPCRGRLQRKDVVTVRCRYNITAAVTLLLQRLDSMYYNILYSAWWWRRTTEARARHAETLRWRPSCLADSCSDMSASVHLSWVATVEPTDRFRKFESLYLNTIAW